MFHPYSNNSKPPEKKINAMIPDPESEGVEDQVIIMQINITDSNVSNPSNSNQINSPPINLNLIPSSLVANHYTPTINILSNKDYKEEDEKEDISEIDEKAYHDLMKRYYMICEGIEYLNRINCQGNLEHLTTQKKFAELWIQMIKKNHPIDQKKIYPDLNCEMLFGITIEERERSF